ncbi:MAG: tetratricopeptide repeat protein [Acidobacteria bacterium]|nr:tetratricopeptide repeat protein [Acidobacteriota bacterium]
MAKSKYSFFRTNVSLAIIGLTLGLLGGFKLANSQYRRAQDQALQQSVAQAASGANGSPADREKALGEMKALIEKAKASPNDPEVQLDVAAQLIQIGQPQEALEFLEAANKAKPNDSRTLAGFGVAYSMLGRFDDAIKVTKQSTELDPKNPRVKLLLLGAYIQANKNLDEATRLMQELETSGIDPQVLASARADLQAAVAGQKSAPASGGTKTVLQHGPDEPKVPPKTGGEK